MRYNKKFKVFVPVVFLVFIAAFAKHRLVDAKMQPDGQLQSKEMDETSGLAASGIFPNTYYAHNDSGDTSRFFAISPDGELHTTIYFNASKHNEGVTDCEDIAVGPGPIKGHSYVYIGDIGDNDYRRRNIAIYRVEEKKQWATEERTDAHADRLKLNYPDGPKDAETLMLDPVEKLLYIVTKRSDTVSVYTTPLNFKANDSVTLTFRCKLFFKGIKPFKWITAGDISKDGQQILLKNYEKVYYWRKQTNEPIWKAMQRAPEELPYKAEKQGEAIAFTPDGTGYYTTSEGVFAPVYYYKIP
ncbi:hypothetical protein FFF34_017765 [Inquilinus sp. KBS0705]|nr:hypothetical protein FFF34_017765 [Inquilinus sp. KBS0705]